MLKDFKAFIMRGSVVDLAVGVIIGAAFGAIIKSLVDDLVMPPIGLATGGIDFANKFVVLKEGVKAAAPYASLAEAKAAGAVTLNYGTFINQSVNFVIVAAAVFLIRSSCSPENAGRHRRAWRARRRRRQRHARSARS